MGHNSAGREAPRSQVGLLILAVAGAVLAWGDFRLVVRSDGSDIVLHYQGMAHISVDIGTAR